MHLQQILKISILASIVFVTGCHTFINQYYSDTLPKTSGQITLEGLKAPAIVRYSNSGIPFIQTQNTEDAYQIWGYVHAADRINQMELMRLTAEGRLSEYLGESAIGIDSFMRKMQFRQASNQLWQNISPDNRRYLEAYARGVNSWLATHQDKLPMDLSATDYVVPTWQADDALLILSLANFGLAGNLHEEIDSLIVAQQLGTDLLPWLFPVYPDEPIPHKEAQKLAGLNLQPLKDETNQLKTLSQSLKNIHLNDLMASNNWAVTADLTENKGTLLANDTHLPIGLPSLWSMIQIETPDLQMAGASIPGIPAIVLGATPDLAWGYTMVMADNQDLFLEQTRTTNNDIEYLYQGQWLPAKATETVFKVKGQADVTETLYETRHGILLNESLKNRSYLLQPLAVESRYGIALSHYSPAKNDNSINALMDLPKQKSVPKAIKLAEQIKVISVNMLFADHQQIGWQLTGSYPIRKKGTGLFPSPGWNGEYDWAGTISAKLYPSKIQSKKGWLASANHRIVDKNYPANFSQTWAHPERIERITELLNSNQQHNSNSMKQMQYDQYDPMVKKLQRYLSSTELIQAINQLPEQEKQQALLAQERLLAFDGYLTAQSSGAALYNLFLAAFNEQLFADAFTHSPEAWEAFVESSKSYSAQADHLLWQDDKKANASPFWHKSNPKLSGKANIVAHALAKAQQNGEQQFGKHYINWQWGKIHQYKWNSLFSQVAEYLPAEQRKQIDKLDSYLNRGPYPAGGNINTINIASYNIGKGFDTLLIPSMRLIVDFSQQDPVWVMNNAGQSANPASPHYADNIHHWLKGDYENLPFSKEKQAKVYRNSMIQFIPKP